MIKFYDVLPTSIRVDGEDYLIDMSFDNVLKMFDLIKQKNVNGNQKLTLCMQLLFPHLRMDGLKKLNKDDMMKWINVFNQVFEHLFNSDIEEPERDLKGNIMPKRKKETKEQFLSLQQDVPYIYASFMHQYKIDLFEERGKLHWYKFKWLLDGLDDNTKLQKVISIRRSELPKGSKNQKARKEMSEAKRIYALKGE